MPKRRVIAYAMHETELRAAQQEMPDGIATDSYVMGEVDEDRLESLRSQGLIIQELPDTARPEPPAFAIPRERARASARVRAGESARRGLTAPDMSRPQFFFVWLKGPLMEQWREELTSHGVELMEKFPTGAYKARLEPAQVGTIAQLPFVDRVQLFGTEDTGPDLMGRSMRAAAPAPTGALAMLCFDIGLHRAEDSPTVLQWLNQRNVAVAGTGQRKIRVYLLEDSPEIFDIPALPEVAAFEEYVPPKLHNDRARLLLGIDQSNPGTGLRETGAGQIVAVADTGLDDQHPDFQGRIVAMVGLGRPGNTSDPHGHGTHVAGSVLGDGSASGGAIRGAAPGAQLYFQSLLDAQGELGGLPLDLRDLFDEAYQNGARIHNNSWGAATASRYTINSTEVDDFVAGHRDMVIVISAGNEGNAAPPRSNSAAGFSDWLSIGSPASCKNALTVGASRSDRTSGGFSSLSYGNAWPNQFPDPPIASEPVSGDPQCLAGFSSRGPCDDRRIKPDVVAPGTDIVSARSSQAPLSRFWGALAGNARYAYMGGTSMAAPLVSGCAALVREYYETTRNHKPSAALIKATLISGTTWLTGADATAPAAGTPNYHQGFGRVDMTNTVPNPTRPAMELRFVDEWQPGAQMFSVTGQRQRFQFGLAAPASSLRICLAYTDLSARALQNNLNLFVQVPSGQKILGNAQIPNSLNIPDPDNNVEAVRIENAPAGTYLIQVTASNLLKGPQDFALVVTGENVSTLIPI